MAIKIEQILPYPPADIWTIVGEPGRVDWVPGVESAEFDGHVRRFKMAGAGGLAERIKKRDEGRMYLETEFPKLTRITGCTRVADMAHERLLAEFGMT